MERARVAEPAGLRVALLCGALVIVALAVARAHWDPESGVWSRFPVHLDEYVHWGSAQAALEQGEVVYDDPFSGAASADYDLARHLHERGFHAYLGAFQATTGLGWFELFTFGPVALALLLALGLYALAERWGAGVETALLVATMPTTLRFLGPGFLVPIAAALPLVVAGLLIALHARNAGGFVALAILAGALWPIHAMGALALLVVGGCYQLYSLLDRPLAALGSLAALAVPLVAAFPYFVQRAAAAPAAGLPLSAGTAAKMGLVTFLLAAAGAVALAMARDARARAMGGAIATGALAAGAIVVAKIMVDFDFGQLYDRSYAVLFLLLVLLAGAGLAAARRALERGARRLRAGAPVALALGVLLLVAASGYAWAVGAAQVEPRYVVMEERDLDAFTYVAEHVGPEHRLALVDGLGTMPFSAITGIPTVFVLAPGDAGPAKASVEFFADGARDTFFLVESGATVVVTWRPVANDDLRNVGPGVYVLREDYVERMALRPDA